jgi:hypothetical protein
VTAKRIAVKKHVVKVSDEEREQLNAKPAKDAATAKSPQPSISASTMWRGPANNGGRRLRGRRGSQTLPCLGRNTHFRRAEAKWIALILRRDDLRNRDTRHTNP